MQKRVRRHQELRLFLRHEVRRIGRLTLHPPPNAIDKRGFARFRRQRQNARHVAHRRLIPIARVAIAERLFRKPERIARPRAIAEMRQTRRDMRTRQRRRLIPQTRIVEVAKLRNIRPPAMRQHIKRVRRRT